jgi:DNA polymerase-4
VLERASNDETEIRAALGRLAESCGLRLRSLRRGTKRLRLTLIYADGCSLEKRLTLTSPCHLDLDLMAAADNLLRRTWQRRIRLRLLRLSCEQIVAPSRQLALFSTPHTGRINDTLQDAFDELRHRFGSRAVGWGRNV